LVDTPPSSSYTPEDDRASTTHTHET
jgi:hypothetical protein